MGSLTFYVLWSLRDAPRQFSSKSNRSSFQVHVPLPLPKQLVIFGLGDWKDGETTICVDVVVSAEVRPQRIGSLTSQTRCVIWEGGWRSDIVTEAAERGRRGVYGKIVLTVCREDARSVFSSTPVAQRTCPFPEQDHGAHLCSALHQSAENQTVTPNTSHLGDSECYADTQAADGTVENKPQVWPMNKTPTRTVIRKRGHMTSSFEDLGRSTEERDQASTPKKMRLSTQEEMTLQIKTENRVTPSTRWSHTMCLSDPDTAILLGGETSDQNYCQDSLWKLELDSDFWVPMNSSASGPVPPCAQGHSAAYDPDSKSVFVYGGLRKGLRYSELYILNTVNWEWKLVTAKGNVPSLAYHSAMVFKRELFVFGGVQPSHSSGEKTCSNALYIFNPEFELWYKPIVEGDKPLPRHSATLLSQRLVIFGGRNTATYLNDVSVLDLGFMEYTAVRCGNMPPLPRGFHAALPVADNRILVSGGCSAIGALQDVHIFNADTSMWSSVASPLLSSKPRAGHSMISLGCSTLTDTEKHEQGENVSVHCKLLVFGGSDCSGTFYNDTLKCIVDIPSYK